MDGMVPWWFWYAAAAISGVVIGLGKLTKGVIRKAGATVRKVNDAARELSNVCEDCGQANGDCTCPPNSRTPTARMHLNELVHGFHDIRETLRAGFQLQTEATGRVDARLLDLEGEVREVRNGQAALARRVDAHDGRLAAIDLDRSAPRDDAAGLAAKVAGLEDDRKAARS